MYPFLFRHLHGLIDSVITIGNAVLQLAASWRGRRNVRSLYQDADEVSAKLKELLADMAQEKAGFMLSRFDEVSTP